MIVVVGEALVDVVVSPEGATARRPGGSPLNVAVGLARLGESTGLLTRLGADSDGGLVREHLEASNVRLLGRHRAESTAVAAARLTTAGDAAYEFDIDWDLPADSLPDGATALHFGSLGAMLSPGAESVVALAEEASAAGLPVSYDPNVRPAVTPDVPATWQGVLRRAALADLVRMSEEDADFLRPGEAVPDVAAQLLERGARTVVVTSGAGATYAASTAGEVTVRTPTTPAALADTVGAGDSFMAALIAATLPERQGDAHGWAPDAPTLERHVRAANAAAAVTVTRPGADPPWRHELDPDWP
jgi:fructokinase